jgi:uncharacterized repeat protein (TIGR03803 family)
MIITKWNRVIAAPLAAALGLILTSEAKAQTFTTLYSFTKPTGSPPGPYYNSDGAFPLGTLALSGNTLYGTAQGGGSFGDGTVFSVNIDGSNFATLHAFTETNGADAANSDGATPYAGLVIAGNALYGTATAGGGFGNGTVFALNTNGADFTDLHTFTAENGAAFTNGDGALPYVGLTLRSNTLYGASYDGGTAGNGTLFAVNTDGSGFTTLYSFTSTSGTAGFSQYGANSDGSDPNGVLVLAGNTLYGTANYGGTAGNGTVFAVNTDGTGFTTLHSFSATIGTGGDAGFGTNSDGAYPGGLVLLGGTLYGTAQYGGAAGNGTVFAINTNGSGFATLHSFTATNGIAGRKNVFGANSDGAGPIGQLIGSGNTLYGTAFSAGTYGEGTVFSLNTNGSGFTTLHSFATNGEGTQPYGGLILSGSTLYGTTGGGGQYQYGTVFSLSLPPPLTLTISGASVILTWPTNAAGFTLQSTANLTAPAVWTSVIPGPVLVNGQNTVTNVISSAQQFYRLSQY